MKFGNYNNNNLTTLKQTSVNMSDDINTDTYSSNQEYLYHIRKSISNSLGRANHKIPELSTKRLQSKIGFAKLKKEYEQAKEKKIVFFLEQMNPIKEITSNCIFNLINQPVYLRQIDKLNREKMRMQFVGN
jgi:hypothetical protein